MDCTILYIKTTKTLIINIFKLLHFQTITSKTITTTATTTTTSSSTTTTTTTTTTTAKPNCN